MAKWGQQRSKRLHLVDFGEMQLVLGISGDVDDVDRLLHRQQSARDQAVDQAFDQ
jgi:hypothetical protein